MILKCEFEKDKHHTRDEVIQLADNIEKLITKQFGTKLLYEENNDGCVIEWGFLKAT